MIPKETISKALSEIDLWLPNYIGLPYKHLGNDRDGIDCFNLGRLVLNNELNAEIPYSTQDSDCDVDVNWYCNTKTANILADRAQPKWGWEIISRPEPFAMILLSIGATNAPNHCALYLNNSILQISDGKTSWVSPYGRHYQQYTIKIARWNKNLLNLPKN